MSTRIDIVLGLAIAILSVTIIGLIPSALSVNIPYLPYINLALVFLMVFALLKHRKTTALRRDSNISTTKTANNGLSSNDNKSDDAFSTEVWNINPDTLDAAIILSCKKKLVLKANKAAIEMFKQLPDGKSILGLEFIDIFEILHANLEDRQNADQVLNAILQNPTIQYREMLHLKDGRFIERMTRPHSEDGCRIWYLNDLTHLMNANEDQALHDTMTQEEAARTAEMAEQLYLAKAELEQNQIELTRLANTDGLTGLNNRRHFMELAHKAVDEMSSLFEIWVIMLDIDHFKKINDVYGHSAGDTAIKLFSETVRNCVGSRGEIGRMGGEEFAVFLPGVEEEDAKSIAETIRSSIEGLTIIHEDTSFQFTTSVGIAKVLSEEKSIEPALDRADAALYDAKTSGRNCIKAA